MTAGFDYVRGLPLLATHAQSGVAFCLTAPRVLYFAYEVERDYLSAPRSYCALKAELTEPAIIATGGQFLTDDQWVSLESLQHGVYVLQEDVPAAVELGRVSPRERHFVASSPRLTIEFYAFKLELCEQLYHGPDAYSVLMEYLAKST